MGRFFIDTDTGQVATEHQLIAAGVTAAGDDPPRPWHPVRAPIEATTLWYSVMRKQISGVFIGTMTFRHSDHHASLLTDGWHEVPPEEVRPSADAPPTELAPSPFDS